MDLLAELGNDFNSGDQLEELSSDKGAPQATSEGENATDVAFVDDCIVEVAVAKVRTYADEYDTDPENVFFDRKHEYIIPFTVSRFGRPICAHFRLDF